MSQFTYQQHPQNSFRENATLWLLAKAISVHGRVKNKRAPWGLDTEDLLQYPENSLGRCLGEFLHQEHLQPIDRLERHDVFHILLDYKTQLKDEAGLYFFLFGNGKRSLFAIGTVLFAAAVLPEHWVYLYKQYKRGQQAFPIIRLRFKELLYEDYQDVKKLVFKQPVENLSLLTKVYRSL